LTDLKAESSELIPPLAGGLECIIAIDGRLIALRVSANGTGLATMATRSPMACWHAAAMCQQHPHGLSSDAFDALFTRDKPIIFAFHGYPSLVQGCCTQEDTDRKTRRVQRVHQSRRPGQARDSQLEMEFV